MTDTYEVIPLSPTSPGAGINLPAGDLANVIGYNGSNQVTSITVVYNNVTFVQTITRNGGGFATDISGWVEQP